MQKMKAKIDSILWALIWLFPVISFFVQYYRTSGSVTLISYIDSNFAFTPFKTIFDNVFSTGFGGTFCLSGYLSYLCFVEIAHIMFDVVVFLPRFAHDFIDSVGHNGR